MKKYLLFCVGAALLFFGAGCSSEPQAKIASPIAGRSDAPLEIVEWFDFQCPACKAFDESVMRFVKDDYVATGKARIVYKNMAFIGKESLEAANASLCAHEAGRYDAFYDKLFQSQNGENKGVFTKEMLAIAAANMDINIKVCIDSGKYKEQVREELREAYSLNIAGTPTLFLNGKKLRPVSSYLQMKQILDDALKTMGK